MIIKKAGLEEREHIFKIWKACFTDDEAYITNYLDYCFPETTTWLLGENPDEFCSVLSIIPSFFIEKGERINGGYLYGVGTLPTHRGKSYSKILMNHAVEEAKKEGLFYILVKPAEESLFTLYKNSGFDKEIYSGFTIITQSAEHIPAQKILLESLTFEKFLAFRERSMADYIYLWPEKILKYAWNEIMQREGIALNTPGKESYFIGYPSEINGETLFSTLETNTTDAPERESFISNIQNSTKNISGISFETPLLCPSDLYSDLKFPQNQKLSALFMELKPGTWEKANSRLLSLPME